VRRFFNTRVSLAGSFLALDDIEDGKYDYTADNSTDELSDDIACLETDDAEKEASDKTAYDTEDDIDECAVCLMHYKTCEPAGNTAYNN